MFLKIASMSVMVAIGTWAGVHSLPKRQAPTIAIFNIRDCFEKEKVARVKEIDKELQALAETMATRMKETPEDKDKLRAQYMETYDRHKLELYTRIDRIVTGIGKERGYTLVLRSERMPQREPNGEPINPQIDRRPVFYFDPEIDITTEVLKRLNESYKKDPKKDF